MRRTLFAIVVFLVLCGIASLCDAGNVETKKSKGITLSGEIKLDSLFSGREVNTVINGLTAGLKRQSSSTFSDPTITLNFDIWLANHVNAFLSLKTPEYLIDDLGSPAIAVGPINMPRRMLEVDQAYVHIDEFGYEELSLRLGVQDIVYDMLENGNPFFLAIGESEDAFTNNFQVPGNGWLELNGPALASSVEAGGIKATYSKKGKRLEFKGDMIIATTVETRQVDQDRDLFALVGTISVPNAKDYKAKIIMTLAGMSQNPSSRIWTLGFGSHVKATKSMDIFAEAYGQAGTYWNNYNPVTDPANISTQAKDILQQGFGGYGGFKYTAEKSGWKPYFGLEWWWLSGDPDRTDRKQQNFISYEDVDDTIILEENNYGYDLDTNYSAIKLRTGFKPGRDWEFNMLYGNFRTGRKVKANSALGYKGYEKIGDELDLQVKWDYTEDITFRAGAGFLWNTSYFKQLFKNAKTHTMTFFEAVLRF